MYGNSQEFAITGTEDSSEVLVTVADSLDGNSQEFAITGTEDSFKVLTVADSHDETVKVINHDHTYSKKSYAPVTDDDTMDISEAVIEVETTPPTDKSDHTSSKSNAHGKSEDNIVIVIDSDESEDDMVISELEVEIDTTVPPINIYKPSEYAIEAAKPVPIQSKRPPSSTYVVRSATRLPTEAPIASCSSVSDADLALIQELEEQNNIFIRGSKAKSTLNKREWEGRKFVDWIKERKEERDITKLPLKLLDRLLAVYIEQYKQQNGKEYQVGCVNTNMSSLKAFLAEKGIQTAFLGVMQDAVESKCTELKAKGYGNTPNAAAYIMPEQEEKMWEQKVFGAETPRKLIYTVIFYMNKMRGWRAKDEARQCNIEDLERKVDENGKPYYEWNERMTKVRRGVKAKHLYRKIVPRLFPNDINQDRCIVKLIDEYLMRRKDNTTPSLFLAVNNNLEKGWQGAQAWYKNQPMGEQMISGVVKDLAKQANIGTGRYTNHSTKKTIAGNMKSAGIPDEFTADFTNHMDSQTLRRHYNSANMDQQRAVCQLLQNPSRLIATYNIENPLATLPGNSSAVVRK